MDNLISSNDCGTGLLRRGAVWKVSRNITRIYMVHPNIKKQTAFCHSRTNRITSFPRTRESIYSEVIR
jgi:hypothetical protein